MGGPTGGSAASGSGTEPSGGGSARQPFAPAPAPPAPRGGGRFGRGRGGRGGRGGGRGGRWGGGGCGGGEEREASANEIKLSEPTLYSLHHLHFESGGGVGGGEGEGAEEGGAPPALNVRASWLAGRPVWGDALVSLSRMTPTEVRARPRAWPAVVVTALCLPSRSRHPALPRPQPAHRRARPHPRALPDRAPRHPLARLLAP